MSVFDRAHSYPVLLFDWLITLTLALVDCDNIVLEQRAGSKSGVYVDFYVVVRAARQTGHSERLDDADGQRVNS